MPIICNTVPTLAPLSTPQAQEDKDYVPPTAGTISSSEQKTVLSKTRCTGDKGAPPQSGEGVTPEAGDRGLGFSTTLLPAGCLPWEWLPYCFPVGWKLFSLSGLA